MMTLLEICKPVVRCSCRVLQRVKQASSRQYSDWFRKRPPTSQFAADIEDVPYRTTIQVNNLLEDYLQIDRYSASGFVLNNGFRVIGPCAVFPKSILSWNVGGVEDVHLESLGLFTVLEPKIDLLLVGVGDEKEMKYLDSTIYKTMKELGIGLEVVPTHQACATFNLLNFERRSVAAALIPPKTLVSRHAMPDIFVEPGWDDFFKEPDERINPNTGRIEARIAEEQRLKRIDAKEKRKQTLKEQSRLKSKHLQITDDKDNDKKS